MALFQKFLSERDTDPDWYYNNVIRKNLGDLFHKQAVAFKREKKYYYMLTFTLDPRLAERVGGFNDSYYDRVERYIKKLSSNKGWCLEFFAYVREGGDEEHKHIHWHVSIKTTKYFDFKKNLAYYEKLYGNVDKSVSKVSTNIYAKEYMSKQCEPTVLIGEWDNELDPNSPNSQKKLIEWKTV